MALQIDPVRLVETLDRLQLRICERFPGSGLSGVCAETLALARVSRDRAAWIARPIRPLRIAIAILIGVICFGLFAAIAASEVTDRHLELTGIIQLIESSLNDFVLIGAAVLFLVTVEARVKRHRALSAIHELRVLAHVIDLHQLRKDPERILRRGPNTASSPRLEMTHFELTRYLDYCSELLSLVSKVAVPYVQRFDDGVALAAVNELEALTTGLSRKVWQKIMILNASSSGPRG